MSASARLLPFLQYAIFNMSGAFAPEAQTAATSCGRRLAV